MKRNLGLSPTPLSSEPGQILILPLLPLKFNIRNSTKILRFIDKSLFNITKFEFGSQIWP